ncbi:acyltransferase family protein [Mariniflexile sp.]|uniref:acyltransferase family protein n=1 Tax=Mariniflexile sp. TaxID=1979402 RepID=UPI003564E910
MDIDYKHRIFGLDIIRTIEILLVLFSHSTLLLFPDEEHTLLTIIQFFGTIGVDLFFVLSGFLIGGIILKQLKQGKLAFKDFTYFWIRRWFRTLPNYFLILTINIILGLFFYGEIVKGISKYFVFLQNFSSSQPDFFTESWSLTIEEFAYILGPLFLYLLISFFKVFPKQYLYLAATLLLIACVTLLRLKFHSNNIISNGQEWSRQLRKVTIYRIDSIYYGFIAAYIAVYLKPCWERYRTSLFYFGLTVFFGLHVGIFVFNWLPENASLFYNIFYLPIVSISLLLLFPLAVSNEIKPLFKRQITEISILSYAMYLVNYSIVLLSITYFIDVSEINLLSKLIVLLFYWAATYLLSYLLFIYFESPLTKLRDSNFIRSQFY